MRALCDRTLVFLHIPKTAGTSLHELLSTRFAPADILTFKRSESPECFSQKLANLDDYRFVHGHMPYTLVDRFKRRPFIVTLLRNPLHRAVSAFRYMQWQVQTGKTRDLSGERARDYEAAARMPIGEFVRREPVAASRHLGNIQSWFLATSNLSERHEYGNDYRVLVSNSDLESAKERLATCDAVGLTERMSESLHLLAYSLKTRPFGMVSTANRSLVPFVSTQLDKATIAALRSLTKQDCELYAYACRLFEERRKVMMRQLLLLNSDQLDVEAGHPYLLSSAFTFDGPIPGDGWYAPEHDGERWFSWTGPSCHSTIELASPPGWEFVLTFRVLHAIDWDFVSMLDVRLNGVRLPIQRQPNTAECILTAAVPRALMRPQGEGNLIAIRVPNVIRPCEQDQAAQDSRLLGIALSRIELTASAE